MVRTIKTTEPALKPGLPCSAKGWCPGMKMALDGDMNTKRAGFQMAHLFGLNGGPSRSMLVYRTQDKKVPPIFLNVCPWCRAELEPVCNPPTKKRVKKAKVDAS